MAKLYFRYGAMGSGKTRDLIRTWYNYAERDMKAVIIKAQKDTKGDDKIQSRALEELKVDFLIAPTDNIYMLISTYLIEHNLDCILVDEAQFLTPKNIEELSDIVDNYDIPVICYGLRTDFQTKLFPGSMRLLELADSIEEAKTICACGKKATMNVRFIDEKPVFEGEQVAIDGKDAQYKSMCRKCRKKLLKK